MVPREGSEIPIDLGPPGPAGIRKEVNIDPWLSMEIERTVLPSKIMLTVAPELKPEPSRVTVVPGGPLNGLMEKSEVTVKFWVNEFPMLIR